jgi:aryl sulfotransferase
MNIEKITWLASYPRSGNTWLRMLICAYYQNGRVDINNNPYTFGDVSVQYTRMVSPVPVEDLGVRGQLLLRPAALLNQLCINHIRPYFVKTHMVNGQVDVLPRLIPIDLTERAVYIVRDPRDVCLSFSKYLDKVPSQTAVSMNNPEYGIIQNDALVTTVLNTWSNHVKSWAKYDKFPIHVVRYEDLCENLISTFISILEFCNIEVDLDRVMTAVKTCSIDNFSEQENVIGFKEAAGQGKFFGKGGSYWKNEIDKELAMKIVNDHSEIMSEFGYIDRVRNVAI